MAIKKTIKSYKLDELIEPRIADNQLNVDRHKTDMEALKTSVSVSHGPYRKKQHTSVIHNAKSQGRLVVALHNQLISTTKEMATKLRGKTRN